MKFRFFLLYLILGVNLQAEEPLWKKASQNSFLDFARWVTSPRATSLTSSATTNNVVMLPMKDRIRLHTSIYLPEGNGPFPVILVRTPYNAVFQNQDAFAYRGIGEYYTGRGYAVVIQTIRGKYQSEGIYRLLSNGEIQDGATTVGWINSQSWCNGNIAVMGVSHDGYDALAAGIENPPGLKLIIAGGAPGDIRVDAFLINGALQTGLLDYIAFMTREYGAPYSDFFYQSYLEKVLNQPRIKLHDNRIFSMQLPMWDQFIPPLNAPSSEFWKSRRIRDQLAKITVPVVHIAGMYGDGDMPDTVRNYLEMIRHPERASHQRLILGWWDHGGSGPYGDNSNIEPYLLNRINAYLDYYLKGVSSPLMKEKPVQVYSSGQGKWIYANRWPIVSRSREMKFYLAEGGRLTTVPGTSPGFDSYTADPRKIPAIVNQTVIAPARDQLVYLSEPFKKNIFVLGDTRIKLFVSSTATDSDFLGLVFVRTASGEDRLLVPLIFAMQARYRNGPYNPPQLMIPGTIYSLDIPAAPTSGVVRKGERLGIVILSNFNPVVVRNAHTGRRIGTDTSFRTATQRIYRGPAYPSELTLIVRSY